MVCPHVHLDTVAAMVVLPSFAVNESFEVMKGERAVPSGLLRTK
jgi:hypothetical protein